jgi:hypothetical protein
MHTMAMPRDSSLQMSWTNSLFQLFLILTLFIVGYAKTAFFVTLGAGGQALPFVVQSQATEGALTITLIIYLLFSRHPLWYWYHSDHRED